MKRVEPLGPDTRPFLDFQIISDVVKKYRPETEIGKYPSHKFAVKPEDVILVRGMFSGVNYPLEKEAAANMLQQTGRNAVLLPALFLVGAILKGMLWYLKIPVSPEELSNKPAGTIVYFRSTNPDGRKLFKTFVFR